MGGCQVLCEVVTVSQSDIGLHHSASLNQMQIDGGNVIIMSHKIYVGDSDGVAAGRLA